MKPSKVELLLWALAGVVLGLLILSAVIDNATCVERAKEGHWVGRVFTYDCVRRK